MSLVSHFFQFVNAYQLVQHVKENISPGSNLSLYGPELNQNVTKQYRKRLARIEEIKNRICDLAHIPPKNIQIRIQKNNIIVSHGTASKAVLAIGLPLLASRTAKYSNTDDNSLIKFLDSLPNDPEQLKKHLKEKLSQKDREALADLIDDERLDLSDEELEFLIAHEIAGHVASSDSRTLAIASTILGYGACIAAELISSFTIASAKWVLHPLFYGVSRLGLQSINKNIERNADKSALQLKNVNPLGSVRFFKRSLITEIFQDEKGNTKSVCNCDHLREITFKRGYETMSERLASCSER